MNDNLEKILKHHPLLFPLFCYFVGQISKIAETVGVAFFKSILSSLGKSNYFERN
jgi:hypothetical protein|tara:strand:- start:26 stop:190 length:165 start_codon:yes stop_codon:yes gene_type:complete